MARKLGNWLEGYLEYTDKTESPRLFNLWTGISCIAAALRKKIYFSLGRIRVYPNLYIVLVAEPGAARKTQAITYGRRIMSKLDSIILSADAITMQALLEDIENASQVEHMPDGTVMTHNSLTILSREFESFLGQKKENTPMLVLLTDLFDCEELPWKYRTKNSGTNTLSAVFLNVLAATTPGSLASSLPSSAIGGGLTTRILFVFMEGKHKKVAIPEPPPQSLEIALIHDLEIISRIVGVYKFTDRAKSNWIEWYESYDEFSQKRICTDPSFDGWYARKPMLMLKVAQVLSAAQSSSLEIGWSIVEKAMNLIEDIERNMGKTFTAVGKSDVSSEVALVVSLIEKHKTIDEKHLLHLVWRDIDAKKFDNVIATAIRSGSIIREAREPNRVCYKIVQREC